MLLVENHNWISKCHEHFFTCETQAIQRRGKRCRANEKNNVRNMMWCDEKVHLLYFLYWVLFFFSSSVGTKRQMCICSLYSTLVSTWFTYVSICCWSADTHIVRCAKALMEGERESEQTNEGSEQNRMLSIRCLPFHIPHVVPQAIKPSKNVSTKSRITELRLPLHHISCTNCNPFESVYF